MSTKSFSSRFESTFCGATVLLLAILFAGPAADAQSNQHILPVTYCCPVSNAPFSGTRVLDFEPLPGATDASAVHGEEVYYRNAAGLARSEVRYGDEPARITLLDFPAGVYYRWTANDTIVTRYKLPHPDQKPEPPQQVELTADSPVVEGVPTRYEHFSENKSGVQRNVQIWYAPSLKIGLTTIIEEVGIGKTTYRYQHVKPGEPDKALFRVPENATVSDAGAKPPLPPPPVSPPVTRTPAPAALPRAIEDDNYLEAAQRVQSALFRPNAQIAHHEHVTLRLIDLDGKQSSATVDVQAKDGAQRSEESAAEWHYVFVQRRGQSWTERTGTSPMRLFSLNNVLLLWHSAFDRIREQAQGYIALETRDEDGESLRCSGTIANAEVCFDAKTGYPASMMLDGERIFYRAWGRFKDRAYGDRIYPMHFLLYRGSRLQMEGSMSVTDLDEMDPKLLNKPSSAAATANGGREDPHAILFQGRLEGGASGDALVRIHVDASGRVSSAELLDADYKAIGTAAVEAAKRTVYMPLEVDGVRKPFETVHFFSSNYGSGLVAMLPQR